MGQSRTLPLDLISMRFTKLKRGRKPTLLHPPSSLRSSSVWRCSVCLHVLIPLKRTDENELATDDKSREKAEGREADFTPRFDQGKSIEKIGSPYPNVQSWVKKAKTETRLSCRKDPSRVA